MRSIGSEGIGNIDESLPACGCKEVQVGVGSRIMACPWLAPDSSSAGEEVATTNRQNGAA